jgi:hypothetical protein
MRPFPLPTIETLKRLTKSLAMLDAIICREWDLRYYSYNSRWGDGESMASMRNGSGDEWFLHFSEAGAGLKGFAHELTSAQESSRLAALVRAEIPADLASFRDEPALDMEHVSFCAWRLDGDREWSWLSLDAEDGQSDLLELLDGRPETYQQWAVGYYEQEIALDAVQAIFRHTPLSDALVRALNAELNVEELKADAEEIDYPFQRG